MQSLAIVAPAIAPLAIKLIDKYLFDDSPRRSRPKIIKVPAPPQYICCCGGIITLQAGSDTGTCSTCHEKSFYRSNNLRLPAEGKTRSLSTGSSCGSSYERKPCQFQRPRTHSASEKYDGNDTLGQLANHLRQEMSSKIGHDKSHRRRACVKADSSPNKMIKMNAASSITGSRAFNKDDSSAGTSCQYYHYGSDRSKIVRYKN